MAAYHLKLVQTAKRKQTVCSKTEVQCFCQLRSSPEECCQFRNQTGAPIATGRIIKPPFKYICKHNERSLRLDELIKNCGNVFCFTNACNLLMFKYLFCISYIGLCIIYSQKHFHKMYISTIKEDKLNMNNIPLCQNRRA